MATNDLVNALTAVGLLDAEVVRATERLASGAANDSRPLTIDELFAMAEITVEDVARAAANWDQTSPAPGLLDAKPVSALPRDAQR